MLNQNKIKNHDALAIMGIPQWQLRNVVFTSPSHADCLFYLNLMQSLTTSEKTFLVKLYQAIEKLLGLSPAEYLTQAHTHAIPLSLPKVNLIFNPSIIAPAIREKNPTLMIDLPSVKQCEANPAIKSTLWKLLKDNIR